MARPVRPKLQQTTPAFKPTLIAQAVALSLAAISSATLAADVCTTASTNISSTQGMGDWCNLATGESLTVNSGVNAFVGVTTGVQITSTAVAGSITNNGTISGNTYGIRLRSNASIGSITNSGHISSGGSAAIRLGSSASITGAINNSGTISGNTYGVYLRSNASIGSITNSGTISGNTHGINLIDSASIGSITNSGTISGNSIGINLIHSASIGSITNSGTIHGNSTAIRLGSSASITGAINNSGTISGNSTGIYLYSGASVGSITNSGTISAYSDGIRVRGSSVGNVSNSGTISVTGSTRYGFIAQQSSTIASITNSGTISGGTTGILITNNSTVTGAIVNSGQITASSGGITLEYGSTAGSVTNSGTISANYGIYASHGSSTGSVTNSATGNIISSTDGIHIRSGSTVSGGITNNGSITASGNAIFVSSSSTVGSITNTGTITGNVVINDSTLNLNGTSGSITGNVSGAMGSAVNVNGTFSSGGTFNVDSFDVASAGIFTMGHGVTATSGVTNAGKFIAASGMQTLTGDYTQSASGMLGTQVVDDTTFGKLVVTGTADLSASNKIYVDVLGSPTLTKGVVMNDILSAGTLTAGTLTVTDNSALFNFTAAVDGNTIDLTVATGASVVGSVTGKNGGSGSGAANVFDDLINNGGGSDDMDDVITALGGLGTEQEVANAVQQTLPAMVGGMKQVNKSARFGTNRVVQARQGSNKGNNSGDEFLGDRHFWFKPVGSWTDQDDRKGVSGFSADTFGAVGGVDGELSDKTSIGLAFSYMHSNVDGNSSVADQSASVKSYQGIVYGSHSLDDRTEINWQADIGLNKNESRRTINFGGLDRVASSDYDSWTGHVGAGISRSFEMKPGTTLTPGIRLDYTYIRDESYTEKGAGGLNLAVKSDNTDELVIMAEGRLAHEVSDKATLTANLGVGYDALSERSAVTAAFTGGGAAFTTKGLDPSPVMVRGGAGMVVTNSSALEITARYDFEVREDFDNQTASVKFRMPF